MEPNSLGHSADNELDSHATGDNVTSWDDLSKIEFAGGGLTDSSFDLPTDIKDADLRGASAEIDEAETLSPEDAERAEKGRQTLEAFKHFFEADVKIKEEITDIAPSNADFYDESSRMRYLDRAFREFSGFEHDFQRIVKEFQLGEHMARSTKEFFARGSETFATSNFDVDNLQRIYEKQFYDMRDEFVDDVRKEAVGYLLIRESSKLINRASSVNELLHAFHSLIMNNEGILQRIPELEAKGKITLRGEANGLGSKIYEAIPEDMNVGITDIISVDDKALMMVRDRAHALMIEAEPLKERPGETIIHYNLPKIINREMVEALPGIGRISKNGASGRFAVPNEELGERLVDFIAKVPEDRDFEPTMSRFVASKVTLKESMLEAPSSNDDAGSESLRPAPPELSAEEGIRNRLSRMVKLALKKGFDRDGK